MLFWQTVKYLDFHLISAYYYSMVETCNFNGNYAYDSQVKNRTGKYTMLSSSWHKYKEVMDIFRNHIITLHKY
jgi:hypothetical protein